MELNDLLKNVKCRRRFVNAWLELQTLNEEEFSKGSEGNFSINWLPALEAVHQIVESLLQNDQTPLEDQVIKVLDVGSGGLEQPDYQRLMIEKLNCEFYGIDPFSSPPSKQYKFFQAVAESMPYQNDSFDLLFCISSLDHAIQPKVALAEMYRVLKPGGRILFVETIRNVDKFYVKWRLRSVWGLLPARYNKHHDFAWREKSLGKLIRRNFSVELWTASEAEPHEAIVIARK